MKGFKLISFRKGEILDIGFGKNSNDIKKFANTRPNADSFHAHMISHNQQSFFILGLRIKKDIVWQKEQYTKITRKFQRFA